MSLYDKKEAIKSDVKQKHGCGQVCNRCTRAHALIDDMYDSSIPVGYWFLSMAKFSGASELKEIYDDYISDLRTSYLTGRSICFSGSQGTGKTMSSICIAKEAIKLGYTAFYITASDILNGMTDFKTASVLRNKLKDVDFLIIDELDSRFFTSDATKELFSGIYEGVFRHRTHNLMPTIICTNETDDLTNVFYGQGTQSIRSLNDQYLSIYPIIGKDFRK